MIVEGSFVSYVGDEVDGLAVGNRGKVLSSTTGASHVIWRDGARAGEVTFVKEGDLVVSRTAAQDESVFESGHLVSVAVRQTYDHGGKVALLNALNDEGHLATCAPFAEEAMQLVASRIRQDPSFSEVLARLDPDEGADFVAFTAACLLRDAFSEEP